MARNRRRYDDKFRASAVVMLEAAGYPGKDGALATVAKNLKMPHNTLRAWYHAEHNPPPSDVRQEQTLDLTQAIRDELAALFPAMQNARADASYKDLTVATAILIDKLQLLTGEPTERTELNETAQSTLRRRVDSIATRLRTTEGVEQVSANGNGRESVAV